jgi:hypothetical protein
MQFLYYRPGHNRSVSFDDIKHWGLEYAFDKAPVSGQCQGGTPDGGSGQVFIGQRTNGEVPLVNMEKQTWRKLPGDRMGAPVYVGFWNENKPTPEELVRPAILSGYQYTLADGHQWNVPLVRRYGDDGHSCALPRMLDFDDEGKPIDGEVVSKYRGLWDLTKPIVDDLLATYELGELPEVPLTQKQAVEIAVSLLQVNYRVSLPEMVLLEALPNDSTVSGLCSCACDWPELIRRLEVPGDDDESKKNLSADDGVSTKSGDED